MYIASRWFETEPKHVAIKDRRPIKKKYSVALAVFVVTAKSNKRIHNSLLEFFFINGA
jgi:hypothetical protein